MLRSPQWTSSWLLLLCLVLGPLAASAEIPLECYQKAGLIPTPNAPRRRTLADESLWTTKQWTSTFDASATQTLDLTSVTQVNNLKIVLVNNGPVNIVNPWIVYNHKRDWFDSTSMLKECLENETDPKKRAFRIWRFIRDNRYHWAPAEESMDLHSPPRFLNVYGYGFCDDSAKNAEGLFWLAGFTNARCWELSGHVVPEVYYNNAWKLLDPDFEAFYPKDNNYTLSSVEELAAHPEWIERVHPGDEFARNYLLNCYTTTSDNSTMVGIWDLTKTMAMTLRPGEQFERDWTNWGKYHVLAYPTDIPPVYGNGAHIYTPDFYKTYVSQGFETFTNIETVGESGVTPAAHLKSASSTGRMVCKMTTPYVLVGAKVDIGVYLKSSSDSIAITFSRDNKSWYYIGFMNGPVNGSYSYQLDSLINPHGASAQQTFYVSISLTGRQKTSAGINSATFTGEIQLAPAALPALEAGMENHIEARFDPVDGANLMLVHRYESRDYIPPPVPPEMPSVPANGDVVTTLTPLLKWTPAATSSTIVQREIMVSWDSPGVLPISPPLWQVFPATDEPQWKVLDGWLLPGKRYYWKARAQDALGQWSEWTGPWTFTVSATAGQTPLPSGWMTY